MKKASADLLRAKSVANALVMEYQLFEPPIPIVSITQKEGFQVVAAEFEETLIIAGIIDLETNNLIVNQNDPAELRSLTIARGLGHWILHRKELKEIPELRVIYQHSLGGKDKSYFEKEALCFAIHLLVPDELFMKASHLADTALSLKFLVPDFVIKMLREEGHPKAEH